MKKTQGQKRESTAKSITIASFFILAIAGHYVSYALAGSFYITPVITLFILGLAAIGARHVSNVLGLLYVRESNSKLNEGFLHR